MEGAYIVFNKDSLSCMRQEVKNNPIPIVATEVVVFGKESEAQGAIDHFKLENAQVIEVDGEKHKVNFNVS